MTLLALEVRLPAETGSFTDARLQHDLVAIATKYLAFFVSFLVIASFWVGHWRKFTFIRRADSRLVWLNIAFLMAVCCVPFASSVLQEHGNLRTAVILYACVVVAAALLSATLWVYALRAGLVDPQITDLQKRRGLAVALVHRRRFCTFDRDLASTMRISPSFSGCSWPPFSCSPLVESRRSARSRRIAANSRNAQAARLLSFISNFSRIQRKIAAWV